MNTYVCLLRGINVGGKNIVKMQELRNCLSGAGLTNVSTYIQSGNIFFDSNKSAAKLAEDIQGLLREQFELDVPTLVRDASYYEKVIANNPFPNADVNHLHATLLAKSPTKQSVEKLDSTKFLPDEFFVVKDVIYLHCPNGYARTKLNNGYFEKTLGTQATTRNWKTINKIVELLAKR